MELLCLKFDFFCAHASLFAKDISVESLDNIFIYFPQEFLEVILIVIKLNFIIAVTPKQSIFIRYLLWTDIYLQFVDISFETWFFIFYFCPYDILKFNECFSETTPLFCIIL